MRNWYEERLLTTQEQAQTARGLISANGYGIACVKSDGTVLTIGDHECGQFNLADWREIVAVKVSNYITVGLKSDGTVMMSGWDLGTWFNAKKWNNIVDIDVGFNTIVGLKDDGTVVVTDESFHGVNNWSNIIAVGIGDRFIVGLKYDGTVIVETQREKYSDNGYPCCREPIVDLCDVYDWQNIVAISAGYKSVFGLTSDGQVVVAGEQRREVCDVSSWRDVVAIEGASGIIGVRSDGTVITMGENWFNQRVKNWSDVVAVAYGGSFIVGLRADGTLLGEVDRNYIEHSDSPELYMHTKNIPSIVPTWRLFQNLITLKTECMAMKKWRAKEDQNMAQRRSTGLCQYCGNKFKGLFSKKCSGCGKAKDY